MSRQYFGTDGIRGRVGQAPITPEFILKLGWAVGKVFAAQAASKVLIGKDTRISGYLLESALESGLAAAGADILLLGPMPTPAVAYLTRKYQGQAGIVISASHNPYYDNGIKFFSSQGTKLADDIELAIEQQLTQPMTTVDSAKLGKAQRIVDAAKQYAAYCRQAMPAELDLTGLTIALDCAHGATYHVAPELLTTLGATIIANGVEPDGLNINAGCGSTHIDPVQQVVINQQADLGIAFDGDGDRVLMVDHQGEVLDGDELLFIMARYLHQQGQLTGGVVGTVMSNLGFERALTSLGIDFIRAKVGDRYVLAELEQRQWTLGGEASGHIIDLTKSTTGDGLLAALQILSIMTTLGVSLHELKQGMEKYPQIMRNVTLTSPLTAAKATSLQQLAAKVENKLAGSGRVLLRPSGTEPLMRVMIEGEDHAQVSQLVDELADEVAHVCAG